MADIKKILEILTEKKIKLIEEGLMCIHLDTEVMMLNKIDKYIQIIEIESKEKFWIDTETKEIIKDKSLLNMLNMTCV